MTRRLSLVDGLGVALRLSDEEIVAGLGAEAVERSFIFPMQRVRPDFHPADRIAPVNPQIRHPYLDLRALAWLARHSDTATASRSLLLRPSTAAQPPLSGTQRASR